MARYIDADLLMKEFGDFVRHSNNSEFAPVPNWNDAVSLVGSAPTADVVERKRGKWLNKFVDGLGFNGLEFECSECGKRSAGRTNYCAYCGAQMKSE